jgi:tetratricopeptide (TPR) repeat protein
VKQFSHLIVSAIFFLQIVVSTLPVKSQSLNQVIGENNQGVKFLNREEHQLAIDKFKQAIKLDPNYSLARENLVIAHNQFGLKLMKTDPKKALVQFHQVAYLNPNFPSIEINLDAAIKAIGKNPDSFYDRETLAKTAKADGDLRGAFVEYKYALKLMDEAHVDVMKSVEQIEKQIKAEP